MNGPELNAPGPNVAVIQMLDGSGKVSNVNVNTGTGQNTFYSARAGLNVPNLRCNTGAANPDNVCICPNSMNSSPFVPYPEQFREAYFDELFSPLTSDAAVTPAARAIADRYSMPIRQ
jgi:hypothetical protein